MSKVIKKNASLAFVLLLSIPVCASQHDTAESIKKVSQSNAIAAAFSAILAKSGVKTAGQNAFAWASRTVPSWQTIRQAPRAGLALVKRGTTAVVNAGRHASSCVVPYVRPAVDFTRRHPRMTQAAVGSLFATGLACAVYKVVKHYKAQKPDSRAVSVDENTASQVQPGQVPSVDATAATTAVAPQQPAVASVAASSRSATGQNPSSELPSDPKGKRPVRESVRITEAAAPSLEDINLLKEEIALIENAKKKVGITHNQLIAICNAAEEYINVLAKDNVSQREIASASENYFKVYTNAFDYSIGTMPERLTELTKRYNETCAKILDICSDPLNFKNEQYKKEITKLWNTVKEDIFPKIKEELARSQEMLRALEMSLGR